VSESFEARLRAQLMEAADRQPRRPRQRRVLAAAAAAVAAGATAVVALTGPSPAGADVEITVRDGRMEVRVTDLETRPDTIAEALEEAGLDVEVRPVPVGPSNVGRFVGSAGIAVPELTPLDGTSQSYTGFSIPADYDGALELYVGRAAGDGETYHTGSDAYAPAEPLSCRGLYGVTAAAAAQRLADAPIEVAFRPFSDGAPSADPLPSGDVAASPFAQWRVVDAASLSEESVEIFLTEDGESPFADPLSRDQGACRE